VVLVLPAIALLFTLAQHGAVEESGAPPVISAPDAGR
jgi:hypothetical protein